MLSLVFKDYSEYVNTLRGIDLDSIRTIVYYDSRGKPTNLGIGAGDIIPKLYTDYALFPYFVQGDGSKLLIKDIERQELPYQPYGAWFHSEGYTSLHCPSDTLSSDEYISPKLLTTPFKFITCTGVDYLTIQEESSELSIEEYVPQITSDFWFFSDNVTYIASSEDYSGLHISDYNKASDFWFFSDTVQYIYPSEEFSYSDIVPYTVNSDFWFFSDDTVFIQVSEEYKFPEIIRYEPVEVTDEGSQEDDPWDDTSDVDQQEDNLWGDTESDQAEEGISWDDTPDEDEQEGYSAQEVEQSEGYTDDTQEDLWDTEQEDVEEPQRGSISEEVVWQQSDTPFSWDGDNTPDISWDIPDEVEEVFPEPEPAPPELIPEPVVEVTPQKPESVAGVSNINTDCTERVERPKELRKYLRMFPHSTREDLEKAGFTKAAIAKAVANAKIVLKNGTYTPV